MLQAWLSIGYIVLLAILVLAFILWRRGLPFWPSLHSWWVSPSGLEVDALLSPEQGLNAS